MNVGNLSKWFLALGLLTCTPGKTTSAQVPVATGGVFQAVAGVGTVPTGLPEYHPQPAAPPADAGYLLPDGTIRIVGFDDMEAMITRLNALFVQSHPGTKFTYVKANSYGALYSLMWGSSAFAPMALDYQSNLIYTDIVHGPSFEIRVAHSSPKPGAKLSPISVIVNERNPVEQLSVGQLTSIFTEDLRRRVYSHWGQVGAKGEMAAAAIHPCGLPWSDHYPSEDPSFGEYMFFRKFGGGQPVVTYSMFKTYEEVRSHVSSDPLAIGLIAMNQVGPGVKVIGVMSGEMGDALRGSAADIQSGHYPLDRYLYLYGRLVSGKPLDPFVNEYMRMVLSREGQQIIAEDPHGYIPLNAVEAGEDLARLR